MIRTISIGRAVSLAAAVFIATPATPALAQGNRTETEIERNARLQRSGAGLRIGTWSVKDLRSTADGRSSILPAAEAWYQRGLDRHVAIESSVAFWGREETLTRSGGITGGSTEEKVSTYIVPLLTAISLQPFTGPEDAFEPFIRAGGGLALGVENRSGSGGALFGSGGSGTSIILGFALQGGAGLNWQFSRAFGASASAGYRWTRFSEDVAGTNAYRGPTADVGLTYRFQYR